ncbi:Uncharacterized membrane protein YhaH, DUF805 family [Aliiroseovarius halocynthiae]|uniref:DUF805 domain-containing protein n=1 Tax=Aliiroseovarius halocynthiae TaxID=985055 RepID=A0A545STZ2_9RHOB|nr:DUF805 domain-containing protein [Aliiroseovarius halocynthiae]SMR70825.1 Uncharacterized membrane protein YhaH, DUF805 family [Aliiroseovarius halocynthiae]
MSPVKAISTCFSKVFNYSGRASRSEFWWFFVFVGAATYLVSFLDERMFPDTWYGMVFSHNTENVGTMLTFGGTPMQLVVTAILAFPLLAAAWRRLQDTGQSGWISLLPLAGLVLAALVLTLASKIEAGSTSAAPGFIAMLLMFGSVVICVSSLARRSVPGNNSYGPSPLEVTQ